jgi:hypothetical protein
MTLRSACLLALTLLSTACALSARSVEIDEVIRAEPANASVSPERVAPVHLLADSPLLTRDWLSRHHYQSGGGTFGDNMAIADLWYDGVHRRLMARSIQFGEVDDPVDIRLGRAEGIYPNGPDLERPNHPDEVVGQIGGVSWRGNGAGFGAYTSGIRFRAGGTMELATQNPETEELVPQAGIPAGGGLVIYRPGGNIPYDLVTRQRIWSGSEVLARCEAAEIVLAGGGSCAAGALRTSMPVADGWRLACTEPSAVHEVSLICAKR